MGHSCELEFNQAPIYIGNTWNMARHNSFLRRVESPCRTRKRLAKVGGEMMTGQWCRWTGTWFQEMKNTSEYREVMLRTVKIRELIMKKVIKKNKSRRIIFPMRMEKISEEPEAYKRLLGQIVSEAS